MRVLVLAGRIARPRWTSGHLITALCGALIARGMKVDIACRSLDDTPPTPTSPLAAATSLPCFDRFCQTATEFPAGFASWAARQRRDTPHDVSLSLTRFAAADVFFPIDPTGAAWLRRALQTRPAPALARALSRHHGAFRALARETFRRLPYAPADRPTRRILAVGPTAAAEAQRLLTPTGLADRVRTLPFFSALTPPNPDHLADLRTRTRALLAIPADRRVVLVSAPTPVGSVLDGLLRGIADMHTRYRGHADVPILLILARDAFAAHAAAARTGALPHTHILTPTDHIEAPLAAADLCALATPAAIGQFEYGATGRLAADALRTGRPLIALSGASGYDLARHIFPDSSRPGLTIDTSAPDVWQRALRTACEERWLEDSSHAATRIGDTLTPEPFHAAILTALTEAAAERANPTL